MVSDVNSFVRHFPALIYAKVFARFSSEIRVVGEALTASLQPLGEFVDVELNLSFMFHVELFGGFV
jgi:hypothetical protein